MTNYDDRSVLANAAAACVTDEARHLFNGWRHPGVSPTGFTVTGPQLAMAREVLAQREAALADAIVKLETAPHGLTGKALDGYNVAIAALEDMKEGRW